MQKKIIIFGASGHAKVIADIVMKSNDEVIGFLDDNLDIQGKEVFCGKKVLGTTNEENVNKYINECYFIIGIGSNRVRKIINDKYPNIKWYTAIHPNAILANGVEINEGSVVMAGSVINPGTVIGKHCIINTCSSVDHDNLIADYVHISPGSHLAGTVKVGNGTWICAGVTVINNITIADNTIVGAGATIIEDIIDAGCTYVGVPARKIK